MLDTVVAFRPVMDQPVGKALAYSAGFGLSRGLSGLLFRLLKVQPQYAAVLLAILAKLDYVRGMIGEDWAELVATTAWIDAVTRLTTSETMPAGISGMIQSVFAPLSTFTAKGLWGSFFPGDDTGGGYFPAQSANVGQVEPMQVEPAMTSLEAKLAAIAG